MWEVGFQRSQSSEQIVKSFVNTLTCFAGSREVRKRVGQDGPPIFRDLQDDFSVALSWI